MAGGKRVFFHSFPFSIETQRPGAPPFNPVSPGGVEFFWPPPDGRPGISAKPARPIRGKNRMSFLLDPPLFCSFSGANSRPRKGPSSHGSTGFAAIEAVAKLGELQAVPGRLARRVKRAWPGGADFYNPGHSCLLPCPLAFSGRKPPCPLPSFKTRPC